MEVTRISWMGVRTAAYGEMRSLLGDVMGLPMSHDAPGVTWFEMADGEIQIYDDGDVDHTFFGPGPTVGFEVSNFTQAHAELLDAGIEFVSEPQTNGTTMWRHFRGPDGNIYEILGPDDGSGSVPTTGNADDGEVT